MKLLRNKNTPVILIAAFAIGIPLIVLNSDNPETIKIVISMASILFILSIIYVFILVIIDSRRLRKIGDEVKKRFAEGKTEQDVRDYLFSQNRSPDEIETIINEHQSPTISKVIMLLRLFAWALGLSPFLYTIGNTEDAIGMLSFIFTIPLAMAISLVSNNIRKEPDSIHLVIIFFVVLGYFSSWPIIFLISYIFNN